MSVFELDLGGGFKLARLLKEGYTAYFEGRVFRVLRAGTLVKSFNDSQGRILNQLMREKAMTLTEIAARVGSKPAAALYSLKGMVEAGVVERHPLPGGSVYYILCWDMKIDLSPAIKEKIEAEVSGLGGWSELAKVSMLKLRTNLGQLSDDEFLEVMRYLVGESTVAG